MSLASDFFNRLTHYKHKITDYSTRILIMNNHRLLTRPHRLLLARFFSGGLIAAVVVTFIVGAVLTQLERDNYLHHATNAARERVARLAAHIGHQLETRPPRPIRMELPWQS